MAQTVYYTCPAGYGYANGVCQPVATPDGVVVGAVGTAGSVVGGVVDAAAAIAGGVVNAARSIISPRVNAVMLGLHRPLSLERQRRGEAGDG